MQCLYLQDKVNRIAKRRGPFIYANSLAEIQNNVQKRIDEEALLPANVARLGREVEYETKKLIAAENKELGLRKNSKKEKNRGTTSGH